jgi:hypothetical protein
MYAPKFKARICRDPRCTINTEHLEHVIAPYGYSPNVAIPMQPTIPFKNHGVPPPLPTMSPPPSSRGMGPGGTSTGPGTMSQGPRLAPPLPQPRHQGQYQQYPLPQFGSPMPTYAAEAPRPRRQALDTSTLLPAQAKLLHTPLGKAGDAASSPPRKILKREWAKEELIMVPYRPSGRAWIPGGEWPRTLAPEFYERYKFNQSYPT